jgi:hypothetical protein
MMSDDNRDLFGSDAKPQHELLDELDSLKELLDEEDEDVIVAAPWEYTPSEEDEAPAEEALAVPELEEIVEFDSFAEAVPAAAIEEETAQSEIPVLEEVAFDAADPASAIPELSEMVDAPAPEEPPLPDSEELHDLVELLVERRLNALRPALLEQVMAELERFYPALKKR